MVKCVSFKSMVWNVKYLQDDIIVCNVGIWIEFHSGAVHFKLKGKLQNPIVWCYLETCTFKLTKDKSQWENNNEILKYSRFAQETKDTKARWLQCLLRPNKHF